MPKNTSKEEDLDKLKKANLYLYGLEKFDKLRSFAEAWTKTYPKYKKYVGEVFSYIASESPGLGNYRRENAEVLKQIWYTCDKASYDKHQQRLKKKFDDVLKKLKFSDIEKFLKNCEKYASKLKKSDPEKSAGCSDRVKKANNNLSIIKQSGGYLKEYIVLNENDATSWFVEIVYTQVIKSALEILKDYGGMSSVELCDEIEKDVKEELHITKINPKDIQDELFEYMGRKFNGNEQKNALTLYVTKLNKIFLKFKNFKFE